MEKGKWDMKWKTAEGGRVERGKREARWSTCGTQEGWELEGAEVQVGPETSGQLDTIKDVR